MRHSVVALFVIVAVVRPSDAQSWQFKLGGVTLVLLSCLGYFTRLYVLTRGPCNCGV